ncbi:hypothetical protein [Amycolatopsis vancoresmycina]|uniref:Uncharacterized protein n=1 Tax=Amycolatopsis vancoresmycina DSM 44592 TaxID=1292037 RepID=R1H9Y0_9PSEU|nr:hypothetical protein [Amycolatopsis vancoresmycina]EOD60470.1 hypothetical protein H480_40965 [Amycolatopsis vancoresmycina DSM 44592]
MGFLDRLLDLVKKRETAGLSPDAAGLKIVAEAFDPVVADSAVLAASPDWVSTAPAVLRHHLLLPPDRLAEAAPILAQDGYELREQGISDGFARVLAVRVQVVDALHCAQERSRMAGLAQRLGGDALGWDAQQPEPTA